MHTYWSLRYFPSRYLSRTYFTDIDDTVVDSSGEPPPAPIITAVCPVAQPQVGVFYSYTFTSDTPDVVWALVEGSLPPGLSLNNATGEVSGVPTQDGAFSYTIIPFPPSPVTLAWDPPSDLTNVAGYNLYRSEISGEYSGRLNAETILTAVYTDNSAAASVTYYYVVKSVAADGTESVASNELTVTA